MGKEDQGKLCPTPASGPGNRIAIAGRTILRTGLATRWNFRLVVRRLYVSDGGHAATGCFSRGVCGAPVCDYLDYDTHYSERYLGHPDEYPDAYVASNILTYAANLTRPLLLMHGTSDDNCYFSGSLRLSDRLFRSGIQHDFLPLAGQTHMVTDAEVTIRLYERTMEFFREHLLN